MEGAEAERPAAEDVAALQRSRIHILLSDRDVPSRQRVLELLRHCSYQGQCQTLFIQVPRVYTGTRPWTKLLPVLRMLHPVSVDLSFFFFFAVQLRLWIMLSEHCKC